MTRAVFTKIEGMKEMEKYGLPSPETIFVFDFKKQKKEIEDFIKDRKYLTIRSDKAGGADFCPIDLKCPKIRVKRVIKNLTLKDYAVILQEYIPFFGRKTSGNIMMLKDYIVVELMGDGPLTWLNRSGNVKEYIKFRKKDLKRVEHFGKKIIREREIKNIVEMVRNIPNYKIVEFTLRPEGVYFWQIRNDDTIK